MDTSKYIASVAVILIQNTLTGQVGSTISNTDNRNLTTTKEKSQPATGSQYVNDKFFPAKVSSDNSIRALRYNAYSDNFEVNNNDGSAPAVLGKEAGTIITFTSDSKKYTFVEYTDAKGEKNSGYLTLIADNSKIKIFGREKVILEKEVFANNSYDTYKPANYKKTKIAYFISVSGGPVISMPNNKKDFSELFGGREKDVLDYIKSNKIDLGDEKELTKLVNYIGTII